MKHGRTAARVLRTGNEHGGEHAESNASAGPAQYRPSVDIDRSPYVTAQRAQFRSMLGGAMRPAAAPVQRAGDYGGLMPEHDTFGKSYTFGGKKETGFTYHHIIPENKLHDVHEKLKEILKDDASMQSETGQTLAKGIEGLKAGGREQWVVTRTVNTVSAINKEFSDYGLVVTPEEIGPLLRQYPALDTLFPQVAALAKRKIISLIESRFSTEKAKLASRFTDLLKDNAFIQRWEQRNVTADVAGIVQAITLNGNLIFDATAVERVVLSIPPQGTKGSNKGTLVQAIKEYAQSVRADDYYAANYGYLTQSNVSSTSYLKRIVRDKALPKENQDELEDVLTWNPGNLHRGPKSELREKADALLDDGGDSFEFAAVNLLNTEHYIDLSVLNKNLDVLLAAKTDPPSEDTVQLASGIIHRMIDIQKRGLTEYKAEAWEEVAPSGEEGGEDEGNGSKRGYMRLKQNTEKIKAAAQDSDIAKLGSAKGIDL